MLFQVLMLMMMVFFKFEITPAQMTDVAMCEPGYYANVLMTNSVHPCTPCSRCKPGHYQIKSCSAADDTQCAPCPANTYSGRWNTLSACRPCTVCGRHQLSEPCTAERDTLCRTRCQTGYYFETALHQCKRCSLCPDEGGFRVYECTQQGGSEKYQCREGSIMRARMILSYPRQDGNENELPDSTPTELAELSSAFIATDTPNPAESSRKITLGRLMSTISILQTTREFSRQNSDPFVISSSDSTLSPSISTTLRPTTDVLRKPSSSKSRSTSLTVNEILMVIGIIAGSGLVSFVTTYITCHFLMKRGIVKSSDGTVGYVKGRQPRKGWLAVPRGDIVTTIDTHSITSIDSGFEIMSVDIP